MPCLDVRRRINYKRRIIDATAAEPIHGTLFDFGWPDAPHRVLRNGSVIDPRRRGRCRLQRLARLDAPAGVTDSLPAALPP